MKIALNTFGTTAGDLDFSIFEELGEVKIFGNLPIEEVYKLVSDCDAILLNKLEVDENMLIRCPKLKYVGLFATGYNVVDLEACRRHGVTVCNVPDYSTNSVSQHVFALLLNYCGKINQYTASVANGDWVKSPSFCYFPYPMTELAGKNFGVYGYGSIGKRVADIAKALGMNVKICTRTQPQSCPYEVVTLERMLNTCDIISLHCPLTQATAKIINEKTIAQMKAGAVLINTARGGLVDEKALANALNSGKLAAACLDTVAVEPMSADSPLLTAKNCYMTPHVAWAPKETREKLIKIAAENLKAYIQGKPQNVVS